MNVPPQYQRHLFVHISQHCPSPGAPPLESVDVRQIYDKFPEKKGGLRELRDLAPHAFFLVKVWADLDWGPSGEEAAAAAASMARAAGMRAWSTAPSPVPPRSAPSASGGGEGGAGARGWRTAGSRPACCATHAWYLVHFVRGLRQPPERYVMNSALGNFTILQVATNRDTQELLLCTAYVFEVSTSERGAQHHIYRLVRD